MSSRFDVIKKLAEIALHLGETWAEGALGLLRRDGLRNFLHFFFGGRKNK